MTQKKKILKTKGTPDKVDEHVGRQLRFRRSIMGISQDKLACAVGLTFQQIQKYERGTNRISAGRLFEFSRILDVPITYFYENIIDTSSAGFAEDEQENFQHQNHDENMRSKETADLLKAYYSIENKTTRKEILKLIRSKKSKTS